MNKISAILIVNLLLSCSNYGQLTFITKLPKKLDENSGIVSVDKGKIWVIEDNGNTDNIYEVNFEGDLLREFDVKKAKNRDWEDLTKDEKGNIYIGDIGNNNNTRKELLIYKLPDPTIEPGDKIQAEEIKFSYPEQKKFPPEAQNFKYNAEALFYHDKQLYIITKNGSRPFTGEALVYRVPANPGKYAATLIGTLSLCDEPSSCVVTAAAISPDAEKVVVLGYGKLWVYTDFKEKNFFEGKMQTIELGATTQLESLCFANDSTLLISDEQRHGTGRNLYSFTLK